MRVDDEGFIHLTPEELSDEMAFVASETIKKNTRENRTAFLSPATVVSVDSFPGAISYVTVQMDEDAAGHTIKIPSLLGFPVSVNQRVMVFFDKPQGAYVLGQFSPLTSTTSTGRLTRTNSSAPQGFTSTAPVSFQCFQGSTGGMSVPNTFDRFIVPNDGWYLCTARVQQTWTGATTSFPQFQINIYDSTGGFIDIMEDQTSPVDLGANGAFQTLLSGSMGMPAGGYVSIRASNLGSGSGTWAVDGLGSAGHFDIQRVGDYNYKACGGG